MLTRGISLNKRAILRNVSWAHLPEPTPDPILSLNARFKEEKDPRKVNLTIGAYRCEEGKPWILPSVKAAMGHVNANMTQIEYLPPIGDAEFLKQAWKAGYGEDSELWKNGNIGGAQALSGTGSVYLGCNFIKDWWKHSKTLLISDPTWPIHNSLAKRVGLEPKPMPYFDPKTNGFNFAGFISALEDAPNGTAVLLHACAHNPTGVDPTFEQWKKIADVFERKGHLAFFDMAYQGFASGSLEKDAQAVKLWQQRNLPFMLAQSFAKSMGLYGLRTGAFSVTCENPKDARLVSEQAGFYARQTWSSPPLYGSTIAKTLIGNPQFYDLWKKDLLTMSGRIAEMRTALRQGLTAQGSKLNWNHITDQIGMFAYTGLNKQQCETLIADYKVYLTMNGRISIAGLNKSNVDYVAKAIHEVSLKK